eukprot:sb/3474611/
MACVTLRNMTLCLLRLSNLADLGHIELSKFQSATSKDTQTRDINVTKSSKNHTISSSSTRAAQRRLEYGPDIVEQPCKVTALHHIGNYGGLGGTFFLPQTRKHSHFWVDEIMFQTPQPSHESGTDRIRKYWSLIG